MINIYHSLSTTFQRVHRLFCFLLQKTFETVPLLFLRGEMKLIKKKWSMINIKLIINKMKNHHKIQFPLLATVMWWLDDAREYIQLPPWWWWWWCFDLMMHQKTFNRLLDDSLTDLVEEVANMHFNDSTNKTKWPKTNTFMGVDRVLCKYLVKREKGNY